MSARTLYTAWIALIGLSLLIGFGAGLAGNTRPGGSGLALIGCATVIKARLILVRYLRLSPRSSILSALTTTIAVLIAGFTLSLSIAPG